MSTLLVIHNLNAGGAQRQIVLLGNELASNNKKVYLLHWSEGGLLEANISPNLTILKLPPPIGLLGKLALLWNLRKAIVKTDCRSVVSFLDRPNLVCFFVLCTCPGITWVPSERNLSQGYAFRETVWRKLAYLRATAISCNSHSQTQWLKQVVFQPTKIFTAINGISVPFFLTETELANKSIGKHNIVVIGRYATQKNPYLLLDALRELDPSLRNEIQVTWYGEDDPDDLGLRQALEQHASNENLPLRCYGPTRDVKQVLDSADALLLCSTFEGTPNVVLEAMARGVPILSSDVSDIPALLAYGERGYLFRSGSVVDLCNILQTWRVAPETDVKEKITAAYTFASNNLSSRSMANIYLSKLCR